MNAVAKTAVAALLATAAPVHAGSDQVFVYSGPCDASAAVALDAEHFVVGDDEHDTLHIYRRGNPKALGSLDLTDFLRTKAGEEADIEAAAAVGSRIYWITSHGRNSKGKHQPSRHRFFATEIVAGQPPTLMTAGQPYRDLLHDMTNADLLKPYSLARAAKLAAEAEGGLNIEGLAATPQGTLLIGLRNPLPHQHALIIPLDNPAELLEGRSARFGTPVELDLGQRGIRSIEWVGSSYLIVAGPAADSGSFALYRWSGKAGEAAQAITGIDLKGLRPEAMFAIPGSGQVQLLSDDGGVLVGGVECKKLPKEAQHFRSLTIKP